MTRIALLFLFACSSPTTSPATSPTTTPKPATAQQTGPADQCAKDDDCFCRVFTGAEFKPGREHSKCCTDATCTDALGKPVPHDHCMACYYE